MIIIVVMEVGGGTICEEWKNDYSKFYEWGILNGWQRGLELDKDKLALGSVGLIYSPEFCCFLTHKENMLHTQHSRIICFNGESKNLSVWCEELSLDYHLTRRRIAVLKWSIEKAFSTPFSTRTKAA